MISIKSKREIELMRETSRLAASTLEYIEPFVKPGVTTEELNQLCHDYILKHGAYPSPLNYHGFPKSVCTSRNDVICHGIPNQKEVLQDGDILNIDVTTYLNKFHGDTNKTFLVGNVSDEVKKLVDVTYQCMREGINQVRPGAHIGDIGAIIQEIAHDQGYTVVEDYCGHGIGREFHEEPQVVHVGKRGTGPEIKPGMTFTIEPMINLGVKQSKVLKDGWTVLTRDGKWSAQFEHTILVTEDGHEILTLRKEENATF
ncbi:type I methionyl aminopeptidase [Halobacteriovorax sp. GB3]|uniref:type I methionyl aminopeptidase n=1 Tax=Halobacteriovorax sp. GB3 TaxID=2719615 RepID=UPI0023624BF9|nr:type I methionyl aminopeptidase [Halobacteriovorax sp. GB3]MDD0853513.1 type I methionyl aminopeptidase [Halobacteriovorax sp. GB3]